MPMYITPTSIFEALSQQEKHVNTRSTPTVHIHTHKHTCSRMHVHTHTYVMDKVNFWKSGVVAVANNRISVTRYNISTDYCTNAHVVTKILVYVLKYLGKGLHMPRKAI